MHFAVARITVYSLTVSENVGSVTIPFNRTGGDLSTNSRIHAQTRSVQGKLNIVCLKERVIEKKACTHLLHRKYVLHSAICLPQYIPPKFLLLILIFCPYAHICRNCIQNVRCITGKRRFNAALIASNRADTTQFSCGYYK